MNFREKKKSLVCFLFHSRPSHRGANRVAESIKHCESDLIEGWWWWVGVCVGGITSGEEKKKDKE